MTGAQDQCSRTPDASLYVLGELRGRQVESYARHLRRCEECAEEVELLEQVAEAVPLLSARQVPARDEEPVLAPKRPAMLIMAASRPQPAEREQPQSGRPALRPIPGGAEAGSSAAARSGRRLKSPLARPAVVGLLALAVLAVATVALSTRAASIRYVRIQAGWARGGAALKLQGNQLELLVDGMAKPTHGSGYQIWTVSRHHRKLSATSAWLHLNRLGEAGATVPGNYHSWDAVAVYVEPLHGSDTTRSGAVVVGDLRHEA